MIKPIRYVEDQNLIEIRVDAKVILKLRSQNSVPGKPYEPDLFLKKVDSDADDNSLVEVKSPIEKALSQRCVFVTDSVHGFSFTSDIY